MTEKINVQGIAIRSGLSRNNIMYLPEELKKFAKTMKSRPILKDHRSETDNVIGLVTHSTFDEINETVPFRGWIKNDESNIKEKLEDERIKEVSIGAMIGHLAKETEDSKFYIAKDMESLELSTVPCAGVRGTSITQTLKEIDKLNENKNSIKEKVRITPIFEDLKKFKSIIKEEKKDNIQTSPEEEMNNKIQINNNLNKEEKMEEEKKTLDDASVKEAISVKEAEIKRLEKELLMKELQEKEQEEKRLQEELDKKKSEEEVKRAEEIKKLEELKEEKEKIIKKLNKKPIKEEVKEDKTKGKVNLEKTNDDELGGYNFEGFVFGKDRGTECKGDVIYRETYDKSKFKRLGR